MKRLEFYFIYLLMFRDGKYIDLLTQN